MTNFFFRRAFLIIQPRLYKIAEQRKSGRAFEPPGESPAVQKGNSVEISIQGGYTFNIHSVIFPENLV